MIEENQKDITEFEQAKILTLDFNNSGLSQLRDFSFGINWPVVYILNNENQAYIGETSSAYNRMSRHILDPKKAGMETMNIIYDEHFNKSVALDLKADLIKTMSMDGRFQLQNIQEGQSKNHRYYQQELYHEYTFPKIWELLRQNNLAGHEYKFVLNSDLYRFSPYSQLTDEQFNVARDILLRLQEDVYSGNPEGRTFFVKGEPGTGKTVLAVFLFKWIYDLSSGNLAEWKTADKSLHPNLLRFFCSQKLSVGLVIPQTSLRKTLKNVFAQTEGLSASQVIGPADTFKKHYDLLIVDESHRLRRRKALSRYSDFDANCIALNLEPKKSSELDWILKNSTYQILIYDSGQSVRASDADSLVFSQLNHKNRSESFTLRSQMRVSGGNDYIRYIESILSSAPPSEKISFKDYDFFLYTSFTEMQNDLQKMEKQFGLCRLVSGYGFPWTTKGKDVYKYPPKDRPYDFSIEGQRLIWNQTKDNWIQTAHAFEEVGSIYTIQGYDLNYAAVIIGPELKYNVRLNKIIFDSSSYYDRKNKEESDLELVKEYVLNTYKVLLTRGVRGTFVYVSDPDLREYLSKYIPLK